MNDEIVIDPNFDPRAQSAFDNLNDATDWTWRGLAEAFARRYNREDLCELIDALDSVVYGEEDIDEDVDIEDIEELR